MDSTPVILALAVPTGLYLNQMGLCIVIPVSENARVPACGTRLSPVHHARSPYCQEETMTVTITV